MTTTPLRPRLNPLAATTALPVSVKAAKRQLNIAESDDSHDLHLTDQVIPAAVRQFEKDTPWVTTSRQFELILGQFPETELRLPIRPVTAIDSIEYRDGEADPVALDGAVYRLDRSGRSVILNHGQQWPSIDCQPEAVVITITAGFGAGELPREMQQAVLLQIGKWFEDRDMIHAMPAHQFDLAYERLITRLMRSSYP